MKDKQYRISDKAQKVWFIQIDGKREGPYSVMDLKRDKRITPDTLVWREGFPSWVAVRFVPELREVFKDEKEEEDEEKRLAKQKLRIGPQSALAIDRGFDFPPIFLWILIALLVLTYILYKVV